MAARSSSSDMRCGDARRMFVDYLEGDLVPDIAFRLVSHIESCPECRSAYSGIQNVVGLLGHLAEFELPAGLRIPPGSGLGPEGLDRHQA